MTRFGIRVDHGPTASKGVSMISRTTLSNFLGLSAAALVALASPACAQTAANERNLVYMGTGTANVVLVSGLPATPPRESAEIWVWYLAGPAHRRSTPTGSFGQAIRTSIDCTDRSSFSLEAEMYLGVTRSYRTNLRSLSQKVYPQSDTIGAFPIEAVCDPAPANARPVFADLAAARAFADSQLPPRPVAP